MAEQYKVLLADRIRDESMVTLAWISPQTWVVCVEDEERIHELRRLDDFDDAYIAYHRARHQQSDLEPLTGALGRILRQFKAVMPRHTS